MIGFEELYVAVYSLMGFIAFFFIRESPKRTNALFLVVFSLIWITLFAFRDPNVGSDTLTYLNSFKRYSENPNLFNYTSYKDLGYFLYVVIISKFTSHGTYFLFFFDSLIIIPLVYSFYLLDPKRSFILFFLFCSFFFFKSMGINIMRQGVSISFFLLGLLYFFRNNRKFYITCFIVAFLFHASILLPLIILFFSKKVKNAVWPISIYIASIILVNLNIDFKLLLSYIPLFSILFENRLQGYINSTTTDYQLGFRLSFVVFNTIFGLIGYYFYRKNYNRDFENYNLIFFMYLFLSANFFLMFNLPYSDRSGLLSWVLIPLILFPFLSTIKYGAFKLYILSILIFIFFYNL